jgi:cobaltochelatase CobS
MAEAAAVSAGVSDAPITCQIDGGQCHSIKVYLKNNHPEWTVERYEKTYPSAPLMSEHGKRRLAEIRAQKQAAVEASGVVQRKARSAHLHEIFDLGNVKAAMSSSGHPIGINVFEEYPAELDVFRADVDPNYIFNIDLIRKVLMALELNRTLLLFGFHGTGKTTVIEQACARTNRPFMRVQHTAHTEESHILGQYVVRTKLVDEEVMDASGVRHTVKKPIAVTEFEPGPLAVAMKYGGVYCADEYDIAMPQVVALYQPVLEGKALVIKEAPAEWRVIKPHPEFRICATGNTNGTGDETGLYQGTVMQNAANYSRFKIAVEVEYMDVKTEAAVIASQARIAVEDATKIAKIAKEIRESFRDGKISMTISPRELINTAENGLVMGGKWIEGLKVSFTNRCPRVDKQVVEQLAQRHFGS